MGHSGSRMRAAILAAGALAIAAVAAVTSASNQERQDQMSEPTDVAAITKLTGVRLPPEAKVSYFLHDPGGDPLLRAKLEMPEPAFERMLADNNWSRDAFSPANHALLGRDEGEWTPRSRPPFPVMAKEPVNGEFLYVGHETAGSSVMVYLLWFRA